MFLYFVLLSYCADREYTEKQAASGFWNGEVENEAREIRQLDLFSMYKRNPDREKVMDHMDSLRSKTIYNHPSEECSDLCKRRGMSQYFINS